MNFSHVRGDRLPAPATEKRPELVGSAFEAMGVSVVCHPHNPYVPTSHCNVRLFVATPPQGDPVWWFGGGFDLTPYYPFAADVADWHQQAENVCGVLDPALYPRLRDWCDRYFYLPHRQEPRGVGGIFFDDLNSYGFAETLAFIERVGEGYAEAYSQLCTRHRDHPYGERERTFQEIRRGRYVEFNLVHDRGTLFGLHGGGRTESILMSLPPRVRWQYEWHPEPGSEEARILEHYFAPKNFEP